jgi:REP element-mobilizing transposase RayT
LVSLGAEQTRSKVMQLIKGESAFWFNKENINSEKFQWQEEYFAVSVSLSQLNRVRNYIKNQEEHHKSKTFQDEYIEFITKFGFKKYQDSSI